MALYDLVITPTEFRDLCSDKSYILDLNLASDIILFGIRKNKTVATGFEDAIGYLYIDEDSNESITLLRGLTDPLEYYATNPRFCIGNMFLAEGYYGDCWSYVENYSGIKAFVQTGSMTIGLAKDRNGILDVNNSEFVTSTPIDITYDFLDNLYTKPYPNEFKIHLHSQFINNDVIFNGNQVVWHEQEYYDMIELTYSIKGNNPISYILFNEDDF